MVHSAAADNVMKPWAKSSTDGVNAWRAFFEATRIIVPPIFWAYRFDLLFEPLPHRTSPLPVICRGL